MKSEDSSQMKTRFGTCSKDCYGSCVFQGIWDDTAERKKLIKTIPIKEHPFTQGVFCKKFNNRERLIYHPTRLKHPYIRSGEKCTNQYQQSNLEESFTVLVERLEKIIKKFGPKSILAASFSGNQSLLSCLSPLRFFGHLEAKITGGGICNEGGCAGLQQLFGTYSITNPLQLSNRNAKLIVIWNSNLTENNNHAHMLVRKAQKMGAKLVVVDNRKTKIAIQADLHLQPNPNTDHLLVALILKKILKQDLMDSAFLENHVANFQNIIAEVETMTEAALLGQIDVDIERVNHFVDYLKQFKHHTIFNIGYGLQKDFHGGRIVQAVALLQIFLGNIGKPGTGIVYSQSDYNRPLHKKISQIISLSNSYPPMEEIPIISLAEALENPEIKCVFIWNFNPASSLPNQKRLRKALMRDDLFVVVLEVFRTETTNYADLIFPAKYDVETNDLLTSYFMPGISLIQAGPCPYPDCLSNHEFFNQLGTQLGTRLDWNGTILGRFNQFDKEIVMQCLEFLGDPIKHDVLENGYHLYLKEMDVLFDTLEFPTPSQYIELGRFSFNFPKSPPHLPSFHFKNANDFLLLTPNHPNLLHSQLAQLNEKHIRDFEYIFISSQDFLNKEYLEGEKVEVSNRYASGQFFISPMKSLKIGTALIYSGAPNEKISMPNANLFTPDDPEDLGMSGSYNSAYVSIKKI